MQKRKINNRKTAILVGVFYIIGTVAGIFSAIATGPSMAETNILAAIAANPNRWTIGTLLILVMGFPLAMIPALTYPIFKKHNEVLAMGTIIFRGVLEAVAYMASTLSMLMLLSVSREYAGATAADAANLTRTGELLVGMGDWINLILALVFSIGAILFNYLLIQTRLVLRWLSIWVSSARSSILPPRWSACWKYITTLYPWILNCSFYWPQRLSRKWCSPYG